MTVRTVRSERPQKQPMAKPMNGHCGEALGGAKARRRPSRGQAAAARKPKGRLTIDNDAVEF